MKLFFLKQCNNPQTKEPKLEQAVRIVPEWKDYDNEIKALMNKWQTENKTTSEKGKDLRVKLKFWYMNFICDHFYFSYQA